MILHDVADDAERVKVAATTAQSEVLLEDDLYRLDVLAVPCRLEELISPAQRRDIEDDLLADVMIDAVDLCLICTRERLERTPRLVRAVSGVRHLGPQTRADLSHHREHGLALSTRAKGLLRTPHLPAKALHLTAPLKISTNILLQSQQ